MDDAKGKQTRNIAQLTKELEEIERKREKRRVKEWYQHLARSDVSIAILPP